MPEYVYYADAAEMPVLDAQPLDLTIEHTATIRDLLATAPLAVRAAHVFDRKGFFCDDDFAGDPSPSRRGSREDIVVQVTVVVRGDLNQKDQYDALTGVYDDVQSAKHAAEIAAKQAAVAQAQADLAAAQNRLAQARRG